MGHELLVDLLGRNDAHVGSLRADAFERHQEGQRPGAVSVCCSDSRVSQEGMFAVDGPGFLFTAGSIGNSVSTVVGGERVLDGSVAYPLRYTQTEVLAVVGHTGCGAVGAALAAARTGEFPPEPGVRADVEALLPIVEDGLTDPSVVGAAADGEREGSGVEGAGDEAGVEGASDGVSVRDRLVEYNVHEQVEFAVECDETADATVYGFVYDLHGAYGDRNGTVYLVNADGERDPAALRDLVDDSHPDHVATLL